MRTLKAATSETRASNSSSPAPKRLCNCWTSPATAAAAATVSEAVALVTPATVNEYRSCTSCAFSAMRCSSSWASRLRSTCSATSVRVATETSNAASISSRCGFTPLSIDLVNAVSLSRIAFNAARCEIGSTDRKAMECSCSPNCCSSSSRSCRFFSGAQSATRLSAARASALASLCVPFKPDSIRSKVRARPSISAVDFGMGSPAHCVNSPLSSPCLSAS
ncbi:Uncharacterised protein [Mycobacteroides abscessus subsp. abscessus]|nr:Uncharacterised protein [Mycobacteroides abscessus subsp. abscessus]